MSEAHFVKNYVAHIFPEMVKLPAFILILFILSFQTGDQSSDNSRDIRVKYTLTYQRFADSKEVRTVNTVLIQNKNVSLFTFESLLRLNAIQKEHAITEGEALGLTAPFNFLISKEGDNLTYYEVLGNEHYTFKEKVPTNWKLIGQDTLIDGYSCKKGTIAYGGRIWNAYYAPDIPTSLGPYKFSGLPGLILRIADSENKFVFSASEVITGEFPIDETYEKYFVPDRGTRVFKVQPNEFYKIRKQYSQLSLNEQIRRLNNDHGAKVDVSMQGLNGETFDANKPPRVRNFIEL